MEKQIAVIGLGIFGTSVALALVKRNFSVLAIDMKPEAVENLQDRVTRTLILDTTQKKALLDAEINELDTVIVAIGNEHLESSIMTTALLYDLGIKQIIARATSDLHERILRQVGAHEVVNPERELGEKVANQIARPGFYEMFMLSDNVCVAEVQLPAGYVGKTLVELDLRRRFDLNVLGVQRLRESDEANRTADIQYVQRRMIINMAPATFRFEAGDVLLIMGHQDGIDRLLNER
ncbi:MAG: TrkA family potassium uptake protein [Victivallales bacterium]|nr:TrkA family potassium uptake protein [Victivallales bacterium]